MHGLASPDFWLAVVIFFAAGGGSLSQIQHPEIPSVAEGNDPDFSTCAVCHEDKTQGEVLHPAVALGCNSCHAVERYRDETDVFLTTEGNDLCFACHEDKRPTPAQIDVHQPVRRNLCTECHEPHSTLAPHLLRRATDSTSREENLCLTCHENTARLIEQPVKHAVIEFGCTACHTTHKSEPGDTQEGTFHLTKSLPGLCIDCHDADSQLQTAHSGQPFATANCAECHNPHGSETPKLLNRYVHPPFAAGCDTCHLEPDKERVVLQEGGRRALCLVCHSDVEETIAQVTQKHPPADMEDGCVVCHSPHASGATKLLRHGSVGTCTSCHSDLSAARASKEYLHRPVYDLGCAVCHQAHGAAQARLLRAEVNTLCLECHDSSVSRAVWVANRDRKPLSLFAGKVELPAEVLQGVATITLFGEKERGHPFLARHPVRGKYQVGDNMTCVTCHAPHVADGNPKLFVTEAADQWLLCRKCHAGDTP